MRLVFSPAFPFGSVTKFFVELFEGLVEFLFFDYGDFQRNVLVSSINQMLNAGLPGVRMQ